MQSVIYKSRWLYLFLMRLLYGKASYQRLHAVAHHVPPRSSVAEFCCGPCELAEALKDKDVDYHGYDLSKSFVESARGRGINATQFDVLKDEFPSNSVDVVVLQASLYQFIPHETDVLAKLFKVARKRVIISEAISNLSTSKLKWIAAVAQFLTKPGGEGSSASRFDEASLDASLSQVPHALVASGYIPGRREKIYVFDKLT